MFHGMRGKDISDSQDEYLEVLCKEIGKPIEVLEIVAEEMGRPNVDCQVASVAISILKEGGPPLAILKKRVLEQVHGQGGLF